MLFVMTIGFWLTVGVLVLRTSLIGFSSVTLHWPQPDSPNSVFHWEQASVIHPSIVPAQTTQVVKITVPRSFRVATMTVAYSGELDLTSIPPKNKNVLVATRSSSGTLTLVLDRSDVQLKNRVFALRVTGGATSAQIHRIDLELQR